jgi:hypothetical protein
MNRRRLAEREESDRLKRKATREVGRLRSDVNSPQSRNAGGKDPWRGAVPEPEPPPFVPVQVRGKRFKVAEGYLRFKLELNPTRWEQLEVTNANGITVKQENFSWNTYANDTFYLLPGGGERLVGVHMIFLQEVYGPGSFVPGGSTFIVTKDAIKVVDTPQETRIKFPSLVPGESNYLAVYAFLSNSELRLLLSYGYDDLSTQAYLRATPASFSLLKNLNFLLASPGYGDLGSENKTYDYVKNKYFPQDAPDFMLTRGWQKPGADEDTTNRLFYFRTPDLQNASIGNLDLSGVSVRLNRWQSTSALPPPFTAVDIFSGPIPITTWDWGRPLACILELQSLGFTAEDLMLTPEETAALAAADPAEVGFKF